MGEQFSKYKANYDEREPSVLNTLSDDLLEEIFIRVNGERLCKSVILVSKKWYNIISNDSFWIQKCLRDRKFNRDQIRILNEKFPDWSPKEIYFNSLLNKNLIKNQDGKDSFNNWCFCNYICKYRRNPKSMIDLYKKNKQLNQTSSNWNVEWSNRSNGWALEAHQTGAFEKLLDEKGKELFCFVTSYHFAEKMQVVDLVKEGVNEHLLKDTVIEVSERYTRRFDASCHYNVKVWLISSDFEIIDEVAYSEHIEDFPCGWNTFSHRFTLNSETNKPVRYILFCHSGRVCV
jgi:hypothetical protein